MNFLYSSILLFAVLELTYCIQTNKQSSAQDKIQKAINARNWRRFSTQELDEIFGITTGNPIKDSTISSDEKESEIVFPEESYRPKNRYKISEQIIKSKTVNNTKSITQDKNVKPANQNDNNYIIYNEDRDTYIWDNTNTGLNADDNKNNELISLFNTDISTTTANNIESIACQRECHTKITNEYNPICGSNNITYTNPGKLECAIKCGQKVFKRRHSKCGRFNPTI